MPLNEALLTVHRPPPDIDTDTLLNGTHAAQQRLALEELLAHHLALNQLRQHRYRETAPGIDIPGESWGKCSRNRYPGGILGKITRPLTFHTDWCANSSYQGIIR
jgi:RecG-like helicase